MKWVICVVTPSYNQVQFIKETTSSILKQKGDFEVWHWVQDGKSSDGTVEYLKSVKDSRFHWVSQKDKGQTDAINRGIAQVHTAIKKNNWDPKKVIFAYLNSDDIFVPGAFAAVKKYFTTQVDVQWVCGECGIIDEKSRPIRAPIQLYKTTVRFLTTFSLLSVLNPITQPSVFIRWTAVEKTGEFNEKLHFVMDYEYWLRLWKQYGKFGIVHQMVAQFRLHSLSKSGSKFDAQFAEQYEVAKRFTRNPLLLFLHRLHTILTLTVYHAIN